MSTASAQEAIQAIRAVRIAAHELANVCGAIVGGIEMAVSLPTINEVGKPQPAPRFTDDGKHV